MRQWVAGVVVIALALTALLIYLYYPPLWLLSPGEYETEHITVTDTEGTELASVHVKIADTRDKRIVGLSDTDSLAADEGMLFIHDEADTQDYVMRNMSFDLDIIFIDSDGTITDIQQASADSDATYSGYGQFVLEVNRGWASEHNVTTGDIVAIPTDYQ